MVAPLDSLAEVRSLYVLHKARLIYPLFQARSLEQEALTTAAIVRRKINDESSPIYQLPSESLAAVASYLKIRDLFTAVHVSHRWRATLRSFLSLWSNIQDGNRKEMLAMLEWSESAPLRVSIKLGYPPEEVVDSLCSNSARIVSLRSDNRAVLKKLLSHPMSSLKALSIRMDGPADALYRAQDIADEPAKVVPSLRALSVGGNVGGLCFCLPHLTHFKFHEWHSQETGGKMLLAILGVFRRCPMLEVVDVGWGEELYNSGDVVFTEADIISLPHLRYLAQEQYIAVDQPWLPDLLHLPQPCSIYLKKPPVIHGSDSAGWLALPFLHPKSPYLSDIRRVKLRTGYNHSENSMATFMEIINAQGTLLSFQKGVTPGGHIRNPWVVMDNEINSTSLCTLSSVNTGSPMVLCLYNYQLLSGQGGSPAYVARGLQGLGNVTTLILSYSAVEPCLIALEPDNEEKLQWCSTVHSLVIHSRFQTDLTGSDILQSLLIVAKKRKMAKAPFRSVTLAIPSTDLVVSPGELAALNEYIERFEFLVGDDALDWDVNKYFIPDYDPLWRRRDGFAFDLDEF